VGGFRHSIDRDRLRTPLLEDEAKEMGGRNQANSRESTQASYESLTSKQPKKSNPSLDGSALPAEPVEGWIWGGGLGTVSAAAPRGLSRWRGNGEEGTTHDEDQTARRPARRGDW